MTVTPYQWTVERYHQAVEAGLFDDQPVELLRGELVIMPPEREPHAYYSVETGDYLRQLLGQRAKIRDAKPITLPNHSEPEPDIAVVKPLGAVYLAHHPYPEDIFWVIEFSNATLTKDLTLKQAIYAEAGIREYWIVNLRQPELIVFRDLVFRDLVFRDSAEGRYQTELHLTEGTVAPLAFPDIQIAVSRLMNA
ncbi:MAG: Uma2 family endonuclease [Leptolyngbya sp. SIO4C1]|nr:Uma2 family endonuclease [Leptolyngbya sp. SIO4C1]